MNEEFGIRNEELWYAAANYMAAGISRQWTEIRGQKSDFRYKKTDINKSLHTVILERRRYSTPVTAAQILTAPVGRVWRLTDFCASFHSFKNRSLAIAPFKNDGARAIYLIGITCLPSSSNVMEHSGME